MIRYATENTAKTAKERHFWSVVQWAKLLPLLLMLIVSVTSAAEEPADHIPLAEITPGMTGYGLTVFRGTQVDTFGVTVIGVQEKVRAAGSLLLIEVSGHDLEISSIAQGMSGSPIYLDGRFAGALAFGWGGALRPIAGVTPAAEMLALPTTIPAVSAARRAGTPVATEKLIPLGADASALATDIWGVQSVVERPPVGSGSGSSWPDAPHMWLELAAALATDHPELDPGPDQWLFQPLGLAGAGAGTSMATETERLVPGAACAVPLVTGDASLGAIGTVTWVDGDQVLMMGHPFMQRGPVNLPLATAEVLTIFPSREMSFKMGSVGRIIGTVHHDLRAGLSGRMGPAPEMIPVTVAVTREGAPDRQYEFAVIDDPMLTPTLVFWALYNGLLVAGDDASMQTMRYRMETTWSGPPALSAKPVVVSGLTAGPGGAGALKAEVMTPLSVLLNNPHEEVRLLSVHATLEQSRPLKTAAIVGLTGPRSVLRPGQDVVFQAEVQPRLGPSETVEFAVTLPTQMSAGPYRVVVTSAADLFALESQRAAGRFQPVNLNSMLEILRTDRSRDQLVLAIFAPGEAMILQGQEMRNLPQSIARTVRTGNMQAQRSLADYVMRSEQTTPWVLTGHAVRSLRVQRADKPLAEESRP